MSNKLKLMVLAVLVMLCLTACNDNWEAPYASLQDSGYNISVRFDVNGGFFAGATDVAVVDVFRQEDAANGLHLLAPEDPAREQGAYLPTRNGYFLAGWYTQRDPRVDENGNALDEYGVLCSESGREQGYIYSGRWDFANDTLNPDPNTTYSADTPALTLYAAWVPYVNYVFYAVDQGTGTAEYLSTVQAVDLQIPQWNQRSGKLIMNDFPDVEGKTFDCAYLDPEMTQPLTDTIYGKDSYVDYETGTLNAESVDIYTTWLEGSWYKIFTADQLSSNARLDGNYILMNDLDFSDAIWPATFVKGEFTGTIQGNGFTVTGINAIQADNTRLLGGLFGSIGDGASITGLTIDSATLILDAGCRMSGSAFGLLAGSVSDGATFENVTVSGTLQITENCYPQADYTVGLLCGIGNPNGITYSITCTGPEDGSVQVTVNDDGSVILTFNP